MFESLFDKMRLKVLAFLLIALWAVALMYISLGVLHSPHNVADYDAISKEIEDLRKRVNEGSNSLKMTIEQLTLSKEFTSKSTKKIGLSHEILRHRAINYAREFFYSVSGTLQQVTKLSKDGKTNVTKAILAPLQDLLTRIEEMSRYLEIDLDGIGRVEGAAEARQKELDRLSRLVQERLEKLQNPVDCSNAKFLVVRLSRPCAFGCNVHHLAYCLQLAYGSGRTLILSDTESSYGKWWTENYLPLSKSCATVDESTPEFTDAVDPSKKTLSCPYIAQLSRTNWIPPAIPADISNDLIKVHAAPSVWFIGQLLYYLMRPKPHFARLLNDTLVSYGLHVPRKVPVAGLHIRRTDKINTEAAFHHLKEYMDHVERRFKFWDSQKQMMDRSKEWIGDSQPHYLSTTPRQIFIATDDPSVFADASKEYPNYTFYGDVQRAKSADLNSRGTFSSTTGIALDIMVLSKVDYIVCTFSSQVCRISYELMQTRHKELGDASALVQSLDDLYYYGGQQDVSPEMIIEDQATGLRPGQKVHVAGNHWDGYAKVVNIPGHSDALIPAYKYRPSILAVPMGNFNH